MNEKELAAELQAAKFDPDEWGDASPDLPSDEVDTSPKSAAPKRRLAAMVSVRLSPAELEAVQARASERGQTVSAYLRGLAVRDSIGAGSFPLPIAVSSVEERYVTHFEYSGVLSDGGQLLTRAS